MNDIEIGETSVNLTYGGVKAVESIPGREVLAQFNEMKNKGDADDGDGNDDENEDGRPNLTSAEKKALLQAQQKEGE